MRSFDSRMLARVLVEEEFRCEVNELAADKDVAGSDPELDVLVEQTGVELEVDGLVVEVEGGDDVGVADGAGVTDPVLLPRGGVGEANAPGPVFGVGGRDATDGRRDLLLFADICGGFGSERRGV